MVMEFKTLAALVLTGPLSVLLGFPLSARDCNQNQSGSRPPCRKAADLNDDGALNVLDAMLVLQHLFRGLNDISAPFAACGPDPTRDRLDCGSFAACR